MEYSDWLFVGLTVCTITMETVCLYIFRSWELQITEHERIKVKPEIIWKKAVGLSVKNEKNNF